MKNIIITLVHLGEHPAPYLWTNIQQLTLRFVDCKIALIYDSPSILQGRKLDGIILHQYQRDPEEQRTLTNQEVPMGFRDGYWRFTLERLIAIHQLHKVFPSHGVLHIESDVLLLPEFPFKTLANQEKLMWCPCDAERDVASLVYSPNTECSEQLKTMILQSISSKQFITDMSILRSIKERFPESIDYFPIQESDKYASTKNFEGIFDGLSLGLWLTGMDPRNYYGVTRIRDTKTVSTAGTNIEPWEFRFQYSETSGLLQSRENAQSRIWNLHVHSKNSKLLGVGWEQELIRLVKASSSRRLSREFSPTVLLQLWKSNRSQGTLFRFILGLPIFAGLLKIRKSLKN